MGHQTLACVGLLFGPKSTGFELSSQVEAQDEPNIIYMNICYEISILDPFFRAKSSPI